MPNLIKSIVHNNIRYTFLFREVNMPKSKKYFVTAFEKVEHKIVFEMKQNERNEWSIVPPTPDWAKLFEDRLSEILRHEG